MKMEKNMKKVFIFVFLMFLVCILWEIFCRPTTKISSIDVLNGQNDIKYIDANRNDSYVTFWYPKDQKLPSNNPRNYALVYYNITGFNPNLFQDYQVVADIKTIKKYKENVIFTAPSNNVVPTFACRFQTYNCFPYLVLYIGNLNKNEIYELINATKIKVNLKGDKYGNFTKTLQNKNNEIISYEENDE